MRVAVGLKSDIEYFKWLNKHLCRHAMQGMADWEGRLSRFEHSKRSNKLSLIKQCATRIGERALQLQKERLKAARRAKNEASPTTTAHTFGALVVIDKRGLINTHLKEIGVRLGGYRLVQGGRSVGAGKAGRAHGEKATFGRPVAGGTVARIGTK